MHCRAIFHLRGHELCETADPGEQVIEVVGDASGKLADGFQPLRLLELLFKPLPLFTYIGSLSVEAFCTTVYDAL